MSAGRGSKIQKPFEQCWPSPLVTVSPQDRPYVLEKGAPSAFAGRAALFTRKFRVRWD